MKGFFSRINNLKEWHNNHWGGADVIIVIPESFLFHWRICSNVCLSYLDNGLWSLEFVMRPRRIQFYKQVKFSKTPSHKTPTNKLHTLWVHNDHKLLSQQLTHTLLWILQWNKQWQLSPWLYLGNYYIIPSSCLLFILLKNSCTMHVSYMAVWCNRKSINSQLLFAF